MPKLKTQLPRYAYAESETNPYEVEDDTPWSLFVHWLVWSVLIALMLLWVTDWEVGRAAVGGCGFSLLGVFAYKMALHEVWERLGKAWSMGYDQGWKQASEALTPPVDPARDEFPRPQPSRETRMLKTVVRFRAEQSDLVPLAAKLDALGLEVEAEISPHLDDHVFQLLQITAPPTSVSGIEQILDRWAEENPLIAMQRGWAPEGNESTAEGSALGLMGSHDSPRERS